MSITLRPYNSESEADFEFMFSTFNSCVEWLASKGLEAQWGAEPLGADAKDRMRNKVPEDDAKGTRRWITQLDGEPAGYMDLTPVRPDYLPVSSDEKPGKEYFIKTLIAHRKFVGRGVGEFLLQFAKKLVVEEGAEWLRVDCWRGPPGKDGLVRYYLGHGFSRVREFVVPAKGKEWPGKLLEIKVSDLV
ncbi:acyl-CoA N-acyltransferase [Mycena filopes]|nr:acyl-CoA N-acyltransferase [Mycena filopes]